LIVNVGKTNKNHTNENLPPSVMFLKQTFVVLFFQTNIQFPSASRMEDGPVYSLYETISIINYLLRQVTLQSYSRQNC